MEKYRSIVLCVDSPDCLRHLALDGARADCGHEAPGGRRARRRVDVGEVILNKVQVRYITVISPAVMYLEDNIIRTI